MRKALYCMAAAGIISFPAFAVPGVDGEISAGYIKQDISGWVDYKGTEADIEDDLKIGDENSFFIRAKLEHPIPILPNLKLMYERMRFSGDGTVNKSYTFGDVVVNVNDRVQTKLDLDHYDFVLFYNLPFINFLQVIDAELGLNIRVIDFYAKVRDVTRNKEDSASFVVPIPMIHGSLEIKPVDLFSVLVEANGIAYQGHHYYDVAGELRIKPIQTAVADLFIGLGYKYEKLKIDDIDDTSADIKIKQPYAQIGLIF
ncbi:outer membrane protein [Persephonella hydrogeniphila]|uniref:Outer membrane protein n=1 Tax=Persephonella hydrogeniphila TaxID=198703 RepID=A0A285NM17_9AQUI|nr:TIGR04219 family outer membrane beta-barrel protein [Persephonella hydrogeniphila]SNZ10542.1 outer membrane protein [Persephonella hydrogeniphila]